MTFKRIVPVLCLLVMLSGCVSSEEHEAMKRKLEDEKTTLQAQLDTLKMEIDELKNGASRLFARGELAFKDGKLEESQTSFEAIINKHPDYDNISAVQMYLNKIQAEKQRIKAEKEAAERKRLAEEKKRKAAEEQRMKKALSNMSISKDKVEGITWYQSKKYKLYGRSWPVRYSGMNDHSPLRLYIGKKLSHTWLRMKLSYSRSDWLFITRAIAFVDGTKYDLSIHDFERDNKKGAIYEWIDISPTDTDLHAIKKIIDSKEALIRFYGQHSAEDIPISKKDKQGLQETLDAFKLLGGTI